jgi:signal transduction histidine kinase
MGLLVQAFSILSNPPGSITFHLFLVATLAGALQASFVHWRASAFPQDRRILIGLVVLLIPQLTLFVISGLGLRGILNPAVFLPPLDRAMTLISLVWLVWLWAFPEPSRLADSATILLTLLIGAGMTLALATWGNQPAGLPYNVTMQETIWQLVSLLFVTFGAFFIFVRKPNGWNNGISVLMLAFLGHGLHLAFGRMEGNYPGVVRLAYMAIYPFLFTLPQRFPLPIVTQKPKTKKQEKPVGEKKRTSIDPKTFHALLDLAAQTNAEKVSHAISRGVAQAMLADLCFLMYLTENKKQLVVASGYDLIREENLEGTSLSKSSIPMLTNSIQRGRPLRLPASSTSADIKGLGELLGLSNPGHVMCVPIVTPEKDPLGGILVLSPYSERAWRSEDQAYLKNISNALVPILRRSQRFTTLEQKQQEAERALTGANTKLKELQAQNKDLQKQISTLEKGPDKAPELEGQLNSLQAKHQDAQDQIKQLQAEIKTLNAETKKKSPEGKTDHGKLRSALEEIAQLREDLKEAKKGAKAVKKKDLQQPEDPAQEADQHEVIVSISQELRQPLSSVVGYTDLLLGESVGILGSLQRKFVERIKSSTARIGSLIDDLIQVTSLDAGPMELNLEPVDLNTIIDNAMSYTSSQIREKNISMHLDLPKKMQPIHADREALQQILIHLLQNAGAATPSEGTITLKVQTQSEKNQQYMLLQVTDTGGGIPPEDLQRVFTRLYRADNVLIQGVGDTGVGLSIAKTLTEAQHGRIWVESETGVGATFSVLLPVAKGE